MTGRTIPPEFWSQEPRAQVERWRGQNPRMAAFWRDEDRKASVRVLVERADAWRREFEAVEAEQRVGWVVWTRPVPEWDARRCIVCRAEVFRLQSEVCPHE